MKTEFYNLQIELNEKDLTCSVISSPKATGDIFIPKFIKYNDKKYNIISLGNRAFSNDAIKSLSFPEDSEVISFGTHLFLTTKIQKLQIPPKLKELQYCWCQYIKELVEIKVSPKNKYFSDINNKYLVGKSEPESDVFDVLILACSDVVNPKIPPQINEISEFSFYGNTNIQSIEFSKDSKIKKINCDGFYDSSLKKLMIPATVEEITPFREVFYLVDFDISPKNRYFSYVKNQFLVKKDGSKQ